MYKNTQSNQDIVYLDYRTSAIAGKIIEETTKSEALISIMRDNLIIPQQTTTYIINQTMMID